MKISLQPRDDFRRIPGRFFGLSDPGWICSLFILSVLMVFCLVLAGCDSQDQGEPSLWKSQRVPSEPSSPDPVGRKSQDAIIHEQGAALPKIVAFGDSLTAGLGVSPDQAYPAKLEEILQAAGYRYEVVNAGVSGETTAGGVRRVDWILKNKPAYVILELGANDALRGQPLEQSYRNLQAIIARLQEEGVSVILAGMKIPLNYGEAYTREFEGMYVKLAVQYQTPLIPFFLEGVAAQRALNQSDGIHPTGEGYSLVVENVWEVLGPLLKRGVGETTAHQPS